MQEISDRPPLFQAEVETVMVQNGNLRRKAFWTQHCLHTVTLMQTNVWRCIDFAWVQQMLRVLQLSS